MKLTRTQWLVSILAIVGVVATTVVVGLSLSKDEQPKIIEPFQVDFTTASLENFTDQDPIKQLTYHYETISTRDAKYAIGSTVMFGNELPIIRKYDLQGNTITETYFGLDQINIDAVTFYGEVAKIAYWEAQEALLLTLEIQSTMEINGESSLIGGDIGALLDPSKTYQDYLTIVVKLDLDLANLEILLVIGDQADEAMLYSLYQVIPDQDDVLMLIQFQPGDILPFSFDNPNPNGTDANMLLQRFTYDKKNKGLNPVIGDTLVFSSPLYENIYVNPGLVNYLPTYVIDGLLNVSIRVVTETEVERANLQAWLDSFVFTGLTTEMVNDIKAALSESFADFPAEVNFLFTYLDFNLLIDVATLTPVAFVLHDKGLNGRVAAEVRSSLISNLDQIFWYISIRYYGFDDQANQPVSFTKTTVYTVEDSQTVDVLLELEDDTNFYVYGFFYTVDGLVLYGSQYRLTEDNMFNTDAMILTIDASTQSVKDRIVMSGSGYDAVMTCWFDIERDLVLFTILAEIPDQSFSEFADLEFDQYFIVLVTYSIN
ncbi:MAG: hypothetical protein ACO3BB_02265, partial [Bacilli bacterium]